MSWYKANVPYDRIKRGEVVWLEDTEDVSVRLQNGFLEPADEPEWNKQLPEGRQWPRASDSTTTGR